MIENLGSQLARAVFRFLSRNEVLDSRKATDEESLLEILDELKDAWELDVETLTKEEDNLSVMYPGFMKTVQRMAEEYKDSPRYRKVCGVPSFALALVMASRIRRHYTHAPWFKITTLYKMLDVHGAVSGSAFHGFLTI
jgi:hypothetical protein